ncbi:metal-sensitive transcriptional regulator [Bdellovibrio sp. HCB2-146]|uniref:metal-sensitive transcriptional regulator n=1 Tax=Bdellovibrio sp. HCB2-146 TaxID=3394362 RepID=UPI0039BCC0D3
MKDDAKHPDHGFHKKRLQRVRGQIDGISRMIDERRYCPDIVIQIRAAAKALQAIEAEIINTHIEGCVKTAIKAKNEKEIHKKIDEIMDLIQK